MNSIIILSNIFLTQKESHKCFSRELGHLGIGKNLPMAIVNFRSPGIFRWRLDALANSMLWPNISSGLNTKIPQWNPRAYNIRKVRFVSPLESSSPSCAFGLEAQKSKKIHNRASYNFIFLMYLKCIKQRIQFLIPHSMTIRSPCYFMGPLSPCTNK